MSHKIDEYVGKLQEQIFEEAKEAYGLEGYERWLNPKYRGVLKNPNGYALIKGRCGDTMQIYLRLEDDRVKEASYETDGCGSSNVCGSFAAEMSLGKCPDDILEITGEAILERLGGLPSNENHCAYLAAETLQEALHIYMMKRKT